MKIKASKFTVKFFCSFIVYMRRFFGGSKISKSNYSTVDCDASTPTSRFVPAYPLETTFVVRMLLAILGILRMATWAEILSPVIQPISVAVVYFRSAARKSAMHVKSFSAISPYTVKCVPLSPSAPIPLRQIVKIRCIYNGVFSLRQWNQAVGLVKRLSNGVPLNSAFRHEPSLKGLMYSAILP